MAISQKEAEFLDNQYDKWLAKQAKADSKGFFSLISKHKKKTIGGSLAILAMSYLFFNKDEEYDPIANSSSNYNGLDTAEIYRKNRDRIKGDYKGLPTSLMGIPIDKEILEFRKGVVDNKKRLAAVEADIKAKQKITQAELGDFDKSEYKEISEPVEGLANNKNLKEIDLSKYKVIVEDADTLILESEDKKPIYIRISGADAPEIAAHEGDPLAKYRIWQDQPYGVEATKRYRERAEQQKNLRLIVDTKEKTYGRSLGVLVGDNGRNLTLESLAAGEITALPFGEVSHDIISREAAAQAELEAKIQNRGVWQYARYKAIAEANEMIGNPITYNTLTEKTKLGKNLNLAAYSSFLESLGTERRDLTSRELATVQRVGRTLRKTHNSAKFRHKFSARKDAYNTIEGIHPGSEGLGTQQVRKHSQFGSGFIGEFWNVYKSEAAERGWGYYGSYKSPETLRAEKSLHSFIKNRNNRWDGIHPGSEGLGTQQVRKHSEFGSGWDPLRKIATKIFKDESSDIAFSKLTKSKEFKEAVAKGYKSTGKKLGEGIQGEVWAHKASMTINNQTHNFDFVVKKGLTPRGGEDANELLIHNMMLETTLKTEKDVLEQLGDSRSPSFYGHAKDLGINEEAIFMEKFELGDSIQDKVLSKTEVSELESFIKKAHSKEITHTDLHDQNVIRAINPETGKQEVAVLDWGFANRFENVKGIGGLQVSKTYSEAGNVLRINFKKLTGKDVNFHEFSKEADLLRVIEHGKKFEDQDRVSVLAINSLYDYDRTIQEVKNAEKEFHLVKNNINARQALIDSAEYDIKVAVKSRDRAKGLVEDVAYKIAKKKSVKKLDLPSNTNDMLDKTNVVRNRQDVTKVKSNYNTIAAKRNAKFRKRTQESVGIGLRQSAMATKGHASFGSTKVY